MSGIYKNGREVVRKGGRFAAQPTLSQQGYDINTEAAEYTCTACGEKFRPILRTRGNCPKCGTTLHVSELIGQP